MNKFFSLCLLFIFISGFFIVVFNSVLALDLVENTWNTKKQMSVARFNLGVVAVDGKIYAIGGIVGSSYVNSNERYDPETDMWVTLEPMPNPMAGFAIVVHQNKIYCITQERTDVYDIATNSWSTKTAMPPSVTDYVQAHLVDGKIFVLTVSDLFMYNPATDLWLLKTSMPVVSVTEPVSFVVNNTLMVADKSKDSGTPTKVYAYNPNTDKWSERITADNLFYSDVGVTSGIYAPQKIYCFGTLHNTDWLYSTRIYDLASNTWTTGKPILTPRGSYGVAVVDDIFYVIGGMNNDEQASSVNEQYIPIGYVLTVSPEPYATVSSSAFEFSSTLLIGAILTIIAGTAGGLAFYSKKIKRINRHIKNPNNKDKDKDKDETQVSMNRKFYGATYLLDQITKKLGLDKDLKTCFPDTYKQILSIAYYLTIEDNSSLSRFEKWGRLHKHPYGTNLTLQGGSELFCGITDNAKHQFLKRFADCYAKKEYWLYGTTSISSYSQILKQVQWGENKENIKLSKINLAITYGDDSNLPLHYQKVSGNLSDVSAVRCLLADFETLGLGKVKLVLDRRFYSQVNVDLLLKDELEFLMALKVSVGFVREELDKVYDAVISGVENYDEQYNLYSLTVPVEWNTVSGGDENADGGGVEVVGGQVFLHLFFDVARAAEDKHRFDRRLAQMQKALLDGKFKQENADRYKKYFNIKKLSEGNNVEVSVNEAAVAYAMRYFGFSALLSSVEIDSITALEVYQNRTLIEKTFENLTDLLNSQPVFVPSGQNLNGKMFVCYLSLIYRSYIKQHMQKAELFKEYTLQSLLDCLDVIECFEAPRQPLKIGEITEKQKQLYKDLEITPPHSHMTLFRKIIRRLHL